MERPHCHIGRVIFRQRRRLSSKDSSKMEFGRYITQEYSILKNIFSFLSANELEVCSLVCREWKKMAKKFVQHTVECYRLNGDRQQWREFNKLINPCLIFHFEKSKNIEQHEIISKIYNIKNIPFFRLVTERPIFTPCVQGKLIPTANENCNKDKGDKALVFFPKIPGLVVKKYEFDKSRFVKPCEVEPLLKAKGVILLSESGSGCVTACNKILHYLYFTESKKKEVRPERPCLAGGLLAKTFQLTEEGKSLSSPVVALAFEGDNVTVNCDINKTYEFDSFFQRLSESVGPKPNDAERFAFIFNCIGRYDNMTDELNMFAKYFPGVPYFGFWSYGEFCIPDAHARTWLDPKKIRVDRHVLYLNSACASYMVVTVRH